MIIKKQSINEVRNDLTFQLARTGPAALRGKFTPNHLIWTLLQDCDTILLVLITDRLLKQTSIDTIIKKFDGLVEVMCNYLDNETQIRFVIYWMDILNMMNDKCLEEEQFEACSNIKKFMDTYFSITENYDND
jgi:hypothetical protein